MKRKGKKGLLALVLVMACLMMACGQKPNGGQTGQDGKQDGKKEGISIVLLDSSNGNAWRAQMEAEMQEAAEKYKADGIIKDYTVYSANDDATVQTSQLHQIVTAGKTDVVIINPVSATSLNPAIDKAIEAGIKVIGVDSVIAHPDVITVATDQYKWAEMQAEFLAKKLDGKGNIIIYNAMAGVPASDTREKAFDDVIAKYPDIKVLKKVYHGWDEGEAKQLTTTMISTYSNIDAILNQDCSPGIMQGFLEAGKDMPKVITSDGSITYLNMWNDYNLKNPDKAFESIIVANPPGMGVDAMKIAIKLAGGAKFKDTALTDSDGGKAILLDPNPVITNENREEWVEKTKSMDESYTFSSVLSDEEIDALFK